MSIDFFVFNYNIAAEVSGITRENSILHAWHFGKRWSYGFL
jgi:hypothetical protein